MHSMSTALSPRVAIAILVLASITFLALAATAPMGAFDETERQFMLALRSGEPGWLARLAADLTVLGGWPFLTVLSLIMAGLFIIRRQWLFFAVLLMVVIGENLITDQLKDLFGRERPDFLPHLVETSSESFPSGHSASAAAVYLTIGLILTSESGKRATRIYALSVAASLAVIVGASRVYLGVHFPSDVLAGWSVGAAWASAVWLGAINIAGDQQHAPDVAASGAVSSKGEAVPQPGKIP